jgi:hypothetical protein
MKQKFGERIGVTKPRLIQLDSIDEALRNALWSALYTEIFKKIGEGDRYSSHYHDWHKPFCLVVWMRYFKQPIDELPYNRDNFVHFVKDYFYKTDYVGVYEFIEFVLEHAENHRFFDKSTLESYISIALTREMSGYKLVSNSFVPITNDLEIQAIEDSIRATSVDKYHGARTHIETAVKLISNKSNPDYRNSIKEAISAVESICKVITGDPKAELGPALKQLAKKHAIHGALESAFLKIYGYTSDSGGLRHAFTKEVKYVDVEDARFMVIACSAFVNYLTVKAEK